MPTAAQCPGARMAWISLWCYWLQASKLHHHSSQREKFLNWSRSLRLRSQTWTGIPSESDFHRPHLCLGGRCTWSSRKLCTVVKGHHRIRQTTSRLHVYNSTLIAEDKKINNLHHLIIRSTLIIGHSQIFNTTH